MKVKELIKVLEKFNPEFEIVIYNYVGIRCIPVVKTEIASIVYIDAGKPTKR